MAISFIRKAAIWSACAGAFTACSMPEDLSGDVTNDEPAESSTQSAITLGSHLPGIAEADFDEALDNFNLVEAIDDGVGPVMNEFACGRCHTGGAQGGAGEQSERRLGGVAKGVFRELANEGGSLRQLFTVGSFNNGTRSCTVPLEREPADATVHNVGRLTTPLFGLGLVDAMPDSFFDQLAANEPAAVRGIVRRAAVLIPHPRDASQGIGTVRVARFGWKAGISNLATFAADASKNEMGITTQIGRAHA